MSQSGGDGAKGSGSDGGGDSKRKFIAAAADRGADSSSSSSIGQQSSGDDDTEEVQAPSTTLDCLAALEDALPMKRGLSGCYTGKAKSFVNLTDLPLDDPDDLSKKEHPVNKKRRLLLAHGISHDKKTGGSSSANAAPALPSDDHQKNDEAADDVEVNRDDDVEENKGGDVEENKGDDDHNQDGGDN